MKTDHNSKQELPNSTQSHLPTCNLLNISFDAVNFHHVLFSKQKIPWLQK